MASNEKLDWVFEVTGSLKNAESNPNRFGSRFHIKVEHDDIPRELAEKIEAKMATDGLGLLAMVASEFKVNITA